MTRTAHPTPPPITIETPPVIAGTPEPLPNPILTTAADRSPWQRMRELFSMSGCDYSPAAMQWAQRYSATPAAFAQSWSKAMPFLLPVLDEIERRGLPGEFALLPYVESNYRPLAAEGNRPAGMWQLMPGTARGGGVQIQAGYDGRLDTYESTRAAMDLLERYDRVFGDWRLANLAFNAGEFRLKKLLGERLQDDLSHEEVSRLALSPTSHEHLAKLLGLSCVIADPERFRVSLPEPTADDQLVRVELTAPIDLRLAARFAGMPVADLRQLNAAWLGDHAAHGEKPHLLVPKPHIEPFLTASLTVPTNLHAEWQAVRVAQSTTLADFAAVRLVDADILAAANGLAPDAALASGTQLLLPGRSPETAPKVASAGSHAQASAHVVKRGDTLSTIARRYQVRVTDLLQWNSLRRNSILRLGMRLSVRAPTA